jgi:prepilin-type N-terminal cleavage/methylation domain-containing protein/prepilin-type processing-associated H-X9-DG protein
MRIKGFTLIELLVVIAIISLLVSLLFPSLNAARQLARSVQCLSLQRLYGVAQNVYASNNDGWYAPITTSYGGQDVSNRKHWFLNMELREALGYQDINNKTSYWPTEYSCPDATSARDFAVAAGYPDRANVAYSYGFNKEDAYETGVYGGGWAAEFRAHKSDSLLSPSDKLQQADATTWQIGYSYREDYAGEIPPPPYWAIAYRHGSDGDKTNILFFDGHCATIPCADVVNNVSNLWFPKTK